MNLKMRKELSPEQTLVKLSENELKELFYEQTVVKLS